MRLRLSVLDISLLLGLVAVWAALLAVGSGLERAALSDSRQAAARAAEPAPPAVFPRKLSGVDQETIQIKARTDPGFARRVQVAGSLFFVLVSGTLWTLLDLLLCLLRKVPIFVPVGVPPQAAWSIRTIIRLVLGLIVFSQSILLVQWYIINKFHPVWLDPTLLTLSNTLLVDLLLMVAGAVLFLRSYPFRINRRQLWAGFRFGLTSYLTFLPLLALVLISVGLVAQLFHQEPAPQAIFTMYLDESRAPVLVWMGILVAVVGPIAEELFFRGVLYGWLRARLGVGMGLGLSAFLFALLHANAVVFFPILGLGLLFGWIYELTGSLAAPIAIHVFHNAGMLVLASLIKAAAS